MQKRKVVIAGIAIAVVVIAIFHFYPRRYSSLIAEGDTISISCVEMDFENDEMNTTSKSYEFTSEMEGYADIVKLFENYSYHRSLASLWKTESIEYKNQGVNYVLNIFSGYPGHLSTLNMGGDGRVIVENRLYRMGIIGNKVQVEFMEQLKAILDENQQVAQISE